MRAREDGTEHSQVVILLHGGGLGPWNYREEAERLKAYYHVVLPILDGHAGSDRSFSTIEENARALIEEIDERFGGQVLLIGGLSLGGQVLVEMLSQRKDICKYALIESALVRPRPITAALLRPAFSLCYPLVKLRWFAKLQSASLHINASYFEDYFADSAAIRKEDMIAFLTANSRYRRKESLSQCQAKVLVAAGEREQQGIKQSARDLEQTIPNAALDILPRYFHGEFSLDHADLYVKKLVDLVRGPEEGVDQPTGFRGEL